MGEGILMYGVRGQRRKYTRDLQGFADRVLARRQARGSIYVFGELSRKVLNDLRIKGIELKSTKAVIKDETILKYPKHRKREKGAVVSFKRFRMVEAAVKHPKNVYIDDNRKPRLIYVTDVKYAKGKVLKVVIEPNQRIRKKYYHEVVSIGVVNAYNMKDENFIKVK